MMIPSPAGLVLYPVGINGVTGPQHNDRAGTLEGFRNLGPEPFAAWNECIPPDQETGFVDAPDDGFGLLLIGAGITDENVRIGSGRSSREMIHTHGPRQRSPLIVRWTAQLVISSR